MNGTTFGIDKQFCSSSWYVHLMKQTLPVTVFSGTSSAEKTAALTSAWTDTFSYDPAVLIDIINRELITRWLRAGTRTAFRLNSTFGENPRLPTPHDS